MRDYARMLAEDQARKFQPPPGYPQLDPGPAPTETIDQSAMLRMVPIDRPKNFETWQEMGRAESSISPLDKLMVYAAAIGPGLIDRYANVRGGQMSQMVGDELFNQATHGFDKASSGGRLYTAQTPFGPTTASTRIGTESQTAANMGNLSKWYDKLGDAAGNAAGSLFADAIRQKAMQAYTAALMARTYGGPLMRAFGNEQP